MTSAHLGSTIVPKPLSVGRATGSIIRIGILGARKTAPAIVECLDEGSDWCVCENVETSAEDRPSAFQRFDAVVLIDGGLGRSGKGGSRSADQDRQLELLQEFGIGVLIVTPRPWVFAGSGAGTVCLPPDSPPDMVHGVLLALSRTRPILRQIDKRLNNLNRLGETLRKELDATDRELRLASRLQRDFLPRGLPEKGPIRFATMFRPCTWVSGDIFDIFRLDEHHWGFYIADAVGHGVAAGLLTMYIKHAIRTKRVIKDGYELVPPSEVLSMLNDQLALQDLPDSQFITGWYGTINIETLELRYSIAGHPPPMLVDVDGSIRELHGDGCLLGLSDGQEFSDETVVLRPDQRIMLYSDGLEETLIEHRPPLPQMPTLKSGMAELLRLPGEELITALRACIDNEPGSLSHADDVTVVVLDVIGESGRTAP